MAFLARRAARSVLPSVNQLGSIRTYRHFWRTLPEDFELHPSSIPDDVKGLMSYENPDALGFIDSYWYWRLRSESNILDPENLPKKNYKQLCRDMGLPIADPFTEHTQGLIELYEYLKTAPCVGPFGTVENPVLIPSLKDDRVVGCTGGTGDNEHVPLWFHCREGFLYRCGECDQIFMLVRISYGTATQGLIDGKPKKYIDPDVNDVFDIKLLEQGVDRWNGDMIRWESGHVAKKMIDEPLPDALTLDEWNTIMWGTRPRSVQTSQELYGHFQKVEQPQIAKEEETKKVQE